MVKSESKCSLKIGDKVKGVEFTQDEYPPLGWDERMARHVGKVGEVIGVDSRNDATVYIYVQFEDGNSWWYPAHLLKKDKVHEQDVKKEIIPKSGTMERATPKSVWAVVDMKTGSVIAIELTREKARQMKARLNGEFKIAKMVFDRWVR